MVDGIPSAELINSFFAQGNGCIAVMEYGHREDRREQAEAKPMVTPKDAPAEKKPNRVVPEHRQSKTGK